MSKWRQKAIECIPELRSEFEEPETSIYSVFFELLPATIEAHRNNDRRRLGVCYEFAEWCFRQKDHELRNAAGVAFYEHLGDYEESKQVMNQWVKPDIYNDIRILLEQRLDLKELYRIDSTYGINGRRK